MLEKLCLRIWLSLLLLDFIQGQDYVIDLKDADTVILKNCAYTSFIECNWTDSRGARIFSSFRDDINWAQSQSWQHYMEHTLENISAGINFATQGAPRPPGTQKEPSVALDIPIFVLSMPERQDRRKHTEHLIRAVGFRGEIHSLPFTRREEVDLEALLSYGKIEPSCLARLESSSWIGPSAVKTYIANALDHLFAVQSGLDAGYDLFGVFEDDLILTGDPAVIQERLETALRSVPPSADMLYLESCYEACSERKFAPSYPLWAKTVGPACSAAILFTRKGAELVSWLCNSIFWGIDNMYPAIIRPGFVQAYVIMPHAFLQDGFWGSSMQNLRGRQFKMGDRAVAAEIHRPYSIACRELAKNEWILTLAQLTTETDFVRNVLLGNPSGVSDQATKVVLVFDLLVSRPVENKASVTLIYSTESRDGGLVEVGEWPGSVDYYGVMLVFNDDSACYASIDENQCELVIQRLDSGGGQGDEESQVRRFDMSSIMMIRKDIDGIDDILLQDFRLALEKRLTSRRKYT